LAFKGDLKDINLADIFQTLAMNKQEGTLAIVSGDRHTEIYFNKDGVRLLASSDQKHVRLGELLLKMKKLTPVELDMSLARQKMTGELLGQALVDMNVVTEADINECVRKQIEEDIYEVFSWKKALFEFMPGEPKSEFYDPARMGNPIAFNVNSVIMEAARRIDEWSQIHKKVPSTSTIYMLSDPQAAIPDISNLGFAGEDIIQIVQAIDGRSTVEDVVERAPLTKFEVCKIIAGLVEAGYMTRLDLKETIRIADGLYREGDGEGAIRIYSDTLQERPSDTSLRLKLAELYETEDMKTEAANEYARTGQIYLEAGAQEDGFALYRKAVELSPKNFSIRQKLFQHYCTAQKFEHAAGEGLFVAKIYWRMNRLEDARYTLEQILEMSPENVEALQMLTNIHVDLEEPDKALERYEVLTGIYEKRNDKNKLVECYRKILIIAPKRGNIRNKLNSLLAKEKKAKRKGKGNRKLAYIIIILLVAIGIGTAYYTLIELEAREKLAVLMHQVDDTLDKIGDKIDEDTEEDLRALLDMLESFRKEYPYSLVVITDEKIGNKIETLRTRIGGISNERTLKRRDRRDKNQDAYRRFTQAYKEGRYTDALKTIRELNMALLTAGKAENVDTWTREMRDYLSQAEILYQEAQSHKDAQEWELMHKKLMELVSNYPNWPEIDKVRLPLRIESVPGGAEVKIAEGKLDIKIVVSSEKMLKEVLDILSAFTEPTTRQLGETEKVQIEATIKEASVQDLLKKLKQIDVQEVTLIREKTPYVYMRKPGHLTRVEVSKLGYETPASRTMDDQMWQLKFELIKKPIWSQNVVGFIEATPVADDKKVYFGTRDGIVYALELKEGKQAWSFNTPPSPWSGFLASPMLHGGKLYIGSNDKNLYVLDTDKGQKLWSKRLGHPILSTPSDMDLNGRFYIGCSDNKIYAINANTREIVWKYETGDQVRSCPVHRENVIYAGSDDKKVHAVGDGTGSPIWEFKTRHYIKGKVAFYTDPGTGKVLLIIGSGDGTVYALDTTPQLAEGQDRKLWSCKTQGDISSSPRVDGDLVYVTSGDGNLYCLEAASGKVKWTFTTEGAIRSSPIIVDGVVYFGSCDQHFYAVSADEGKPLWKYKTQGEILGGACVSGKYILVGSTDLKIYCFIKD
jgi:outer membrane protein assembly factor BamB/tetratricopeptide (TPR) repeat protein